MAGKLWIVHYDAGVPSTLAPYPPRTLLEYVADTARQRFDHPALIFKNRRLTYGVLERQSQAFAATLREWGVKKGDRVALVLSNCPQFVIAELAAWKAGAIVVPLNPLYTADELVELLAGCGAETVVVLTPFYARVKSVQARTAVKRVVVTSMRGYVPSLLRVAYSVTHAWQAGHHIRLDVHFVSSLPVMRQPVCRAWVDTRPVQISWAERFPRPDPDVVDDASD